MFGLKLTWGYALNIFQPLKKITQQIRIYARAASTFYVPVAPRIASILCPSESNIECKMVQDYVHTSH